MKKYFLFFVVMIFIILGNNSIYAKETVNIDRTGHVYLYGENNQVIANYYPLCDGGYIVLNYDETDYIEFSDTSLNLDIEGKYYYCGISEIYKDCGTCLRNCFSNEIFNKDGVCFNIEIDDIEKKSSSLTSSIVNSTASNDLTIISSGTLPYGTYRFSSAKKDSCGAVATAILLKYYYDHIDSSILLSGYTSGLTPSKLINYLYDNFIKAGATYTKLKNGINNYFSKNKIGYKASYKKLSGSSLYNSIVSKIDAKVPIICGLSDHPKYGNHWVVATGYIFTYSKSFGFARAIVINDGWGTNGVSVNINYFDGYVYIYES